MNQKKYLLILYLIIITIVITISIQAFWNYKNYQFNLQQFKNDIQISLDNAVSNYYADIAKSDFLTFVDTNSDTLQQTSLYLKEKTDSFFIENTLNDINKQFKTDTINIKTIKGFTRIIEPKGSQRAITVINGKGAKLMQTFKGKKKADSLKMLKDITTIFVSIQRDSLDFKKLSGFLAKELSRKNIAIPYEFRYYKNETIIDAHTEQLEKQDYFSTFANSTYLKNGEKLELLFANKSKNMLQRGWVGILLSFILSLIIVSSLFYLLHIIKKQKELAEIKNDLISNITHEFKTPITTASTAIEALHHFDALHDTDKTKDYLNISSDQLKKLHFMVEKLLETATLDSENLLLNKEPSNIVGLIEKCTQKQQLSIQDKKIKFNTTHEILTLNVDPFHFENVINNLIDNAIKYGGSSIEVAIKSTLNTIIITITDNGKGIEKNQQDKIFDKFYRIPKGNTHDIKGFGIGLYYAKKIIEKHHGIISLTSDNNKTIFEIKIPLL